MVLEKDDFVSYKDSYYHSSCLIEELVGKKRRGLPESEANKLVESLKAETQAKAKEIIDRNHLYTWLQRKYDLVIIPSYVFQKFEAIYKGEFKGQAQPIPPDDLLDMFQRKWDELCQLANWKRLEGVNRLNYDIAVILGKSTSYYRWKDQQKSKEEEIKELVNYKPIDIRMPVGNSQGTNYIIEDEDED